MSDTKHCWHQTAMYTNGLGVGGTESLRCCWCGLNVARRWMSVVNPRHGSHVQIRELQYEPEEGIDQRCPARMEVKA